MQRPVAVVGEVVGDVDQGVDRPQAHRGQLALQPLRRRSVLQAADQPPREGRAGVRSRDADFEGTWEGALHRRHRQVLQAADAGRGEVAGDAGHAQPVGPVGGHLEIDHCFQAERLGGGRADGKVVRQFDDAVRFLGGLQLGGRTQHAVGDHAPHGPGLQGDAAAGDVGPDRGVDGDQAGAGVGRAADDLLAAVPGVDLADAQAVGVGVLHRLDDAGDREGLQLRAGILDVLDLEAGHGHGVHHLIDRGVGGEVILEPGKGELHAVLPILPRLAGEVARRIAPRQRGRWRDSGASGGPSTASRSPSPVARGRIWSAIFIS